MPLHPFIFAQAAPQASGQILWMLAIVAALAIAVGVAAWIIRRFTVGSNRDEPLSAGFTLSDIRRLHRQGQMSDDEYETAKRLLIAQGLAAMDPPDKAEGLEPESEARDGKKLPPDADKMGDGDAEPNAG